MLAITAVLGSLLVLFYSGLVLRSHITAVERVK